MLGCLVLRSVIWVMGARVMGDGNKLPL